MPDVEVTAETGGEQGAATGTSLAVLRHPRAWVAVAWSLFQMYTATFGQFDVFIQLPVHVAFALTLCFMHAKEGASAARRWGDRAAAALAVATGVYFVANNLRIASRMRFVDPVPLPDIVVGVVMLALIFEASRRVAGGALTILSGLFAVYAFVGPWMPGFLRHTGVGLDRFIDNQFLTDDGVFGIPILVSATYIYLFVLFGAFLGRIGLIQFFTDLALSLAGWTKGGAAKVAVITSALFGTINGSAIANAVTTGAFTIPLMTRGGYRPHFAAGVESTASMGGQLMPPVMGAAAFIMAEYLGVPYLKIAAAAAIPAVLYFFAIGAMVHIEAVKEKIPPIPRDQLPHIGPLLARKGYLLIPPLALVWFLLDGRTPLYAGSLAIELGMLIGFVQLPVGWSLRALPPAAVALGLGVGYDLILAALWGLAAAAAAAAFSPAFRTMVREYLLAMVDGAYASLPVAVACAIVGVVVGVTALSGLGLKLAGGILAISQGNLFITLALTMVAALVLGTGLPTSATYIITSIIAAPALVKFGLPPLVAHMFVFYYGILADLTPPTAIATYATSAIAGADVWKTQMTAMFMALSGFIIPFSFSYDPSILLISTSVWHVAGQAVTAAIGIMMLSAGVLGFFQSRTLAYERVMLLAGALLLIFPGWKTDVVGLAILVAVFVSQRVRRAPLKREALL
jgi:TRAP transporter 4TM/12TM fusion protein